MMGAAINLGEIYAHLARDLITGSYTTPGFDHALHNARLIEAVARAADRGVRGSDASRQRRLSVPMLDIADLRRPCVTPSLPERCGRRGK
jgi:hypothetical protein